MINLFRVRPRGFNVGNQTIDVALSRLLRTIFSDRANLVPIPAVESEEEGSLSGLNARTIHEMNLYGHGVVVGGGNLYENGQLDLDPHALESLRPPLLLCSLAHGRIYDHFGRLTRRTDSMPDERIAALNRRASASLVRDDATLAHLRGLGIADAVLGGCPSLFLDDLVPHTSETALDPPGALVSVRNPRLMSVPSTHQVSVHGEVRAIVDALGEEGFGPVRLLCHDKRDMHFASTFEDVEYLLCDDVFSYLDLLRQAPLVVSYRLHAFLPCLSFGTPAVNISYDERSLSMVRTIGLDSWDINLVTGTDVVAEVRDRVGRLADLVTLIEEAQPTWAALRASLTDTLEHFAQEVFAYASQMSRAPA